MAPYIYIYIYIKVQPANWTHPSYWTTAEYKLAMAMQPNIVIAMFGTNDADEWCATQPINGTCPGGTSKHYFNDFTAMLAGFKALPTVDKTFVMIPPPYSYMQVCEIALACAIHAKKNNGDSMYFPSPFFFLFPRFFFFLVWYWYHSYCQILPELQLLVSTISRPIPYYLFSNTYSYHFA